MADRRDEDRGDEGQFPWGVFRSDPWREDGTADLVALGLEPQGALLAGLRGVLALALSDLEGGRKAEDDTAAAPIAGRGPDLAATFARIADDLLHQLEIHGAGLDHVRIDGMLETDDGGYAAWGYAVGRRGSAPPPPVDLASPPEAGPDGEGRIALRCTLRRV